MIKADVRPDMRRIFELFNYKPLSTTSPRNWDAVLSELRYPRPDTSRDIVHKAVCHVAGWTAVLDPELIMVADAKACAELSARYGATVFGMVCQGTSGTYMFSLYDRDHRRTYWRSDGEVLEDHGPPLPEEAGIDLAELFEDDVLLIMERMGVPFGAIESAAHDVWALDESHMGPASAPVAVEPPKRPWWKLW